MKTPPASKLFCTSVAALAWLSAHLFAQSGSPLYDAPSVDLQSMRLELEQLRTRNEQSLKARRAKVVAEVTAAAVSGERAAAFIQNAVRSVRFEGVDKEAAAVRDWKDDEGGVYGVKEVQTAARLHLVWLTHTLQHMNGRKTSELLPAVVEYVRAAMAFDSELERMEEEIAKDKERDKAGRSGMPHKSSETAPIVRRVAERLMKTSVVGSDVARLYRISDLFQSVQGAVERDSNRGGGQSAGGWEMQPGNVTGIFNAVILPEFRATKDPRLLEYWEMEIKRAQEAASKKKLDVDQRDWLQVRRPSLLWRRAKDMELLGLRNRALSEMFSLVKAYPEHPDFASWTEALDAVLNPAPKPAPAP